MREWRREAEAFRQAHFGTGLPSRAPRVEASAESPAGTGEPPSAVRILSQARHEDARGFLQKILTASQCEGRVPQGEVYVTAARPGEAKGNHFHRRMGEWFAVVQGSGALQLRDPDTGARREIELAASNPRTVYVPAGLAHAVVNTGEDTLICVAWAEGEHDPTDVYPLPVWPPPADREIGRASCRERV